MKKNAIAIACTAALALVLCVPFGLMSNAPSPGAVVAGDAVGQASWGAVASDGSGSGEAAEAADAVDDGPFGGAEYVSGVALVTFAEGVDSQAALAQLVEDTGIEGLSIVEQDPDFVELSIPGTIATDEAIQRISMSSAVDAVQPNFVYHIADEGTGASLTPRASLDLEAGTIQLNTQATINDNDDATLWHLNASQGIDAYDAWDVVKNHNYEDTSDDTVTKERVTVAVLDNCFNVDHPDLKNNINPDLKAYSTAEGVSSDKVGDTTGVKDSDHGTHVAGIISAQANNGLGTAAGVSYNAWVLPIRVCDSKNDITTDALVKAYRYILNKDTEDKKRSANDKYNIRVINISIGGGRSNLDWSSEDEKLFRQIDLAYDKGIVTVTAACNADSSSNGVAKEAPFYAFPADYDKCVSVISVDKNRKRSSSSNYNKDGQTAKDISAPGEGIFSAKFSGYGTKSGTSMAAPVVSGTLALMFAKNPNLTAEQAISRLYSTATDLGDKGWDAETGYGLVNAQSAVSVTAGVSGSKAVGKGSNTTLSVTSDNGGGSWTWASSDPSIATVEKTGASEGRVTGVSPGTVEISVTDGTTTLHQVMTVYDSTIRSKTAGFTIADGMASLKYLDSAQLEVADTQPAVWVWSSSDPDSVSVGSGTGVITVKKVVASSVTITATLSGSSNVSSSIQVKTTPLDISSAVVRLSPSSYVYDGSECKPEVTMVRVGDITLTPDVDYQVSSYSHNNGVGEGKVTILGLGSCRGTAIATFPIYSTQEEQEAYGGGSSEGGEEGQLAGNKAMHRLYNPWTGEHFYTAKASERDEVEAAGWTYEGIGWTAPATGNPVYRLYNSYGGEHHYTLSETERNDLLDAGWTNEGIGWFSDPDKTVPLYREYNPNMFSCNHNYTKDPEEHSGLVALGWLDEGEAWYGI